MSSKFSLEATCSHLRTVRKLKTQVFDILILCFLGRNSMRVAKRAELLAIYIKKLSLSPRLDKV